jgi:hypothetical protein
VWNFIPLAISRGEKRFTAHPHLTLSIGRERAYACVIIPNGLKPELRSNLRILGEDGLGSMVTTVTRQLRQATRQDPGAAPWIEVVQRRYPTRRENPIYDATLSFDPRTAVRHRVSAEAPKPQAEWLDATVRAFLNRRSNLQFAIGAAFTYARSRYVSTSVLLDLIESSWLACRPLIDATIGRLPSKR